MTSLELHRWIVAFALAAVRMSGCLAILPATSDSMITGIARRVAVLSFALLAVPAVHGSMPPGVPDLTALVVMTVHEAVIGLFLGFFASIPFWVGENIGNFIDNQRGATMGEVYSPLSGTQVSTTGILFTQIVSTLFFVTGAVFLVLGAVYASYLIWPTFGKGISFNPETHVFMLTTLDTMLRDTVVITAPVIILMFLATVGLGFVNRTAPQLNVFFLSMPIKSGLGIAMLVIYLPFIMDKLIYTDRGAILDPVVKLLGGAS